MRAPISSALAAAASTRVRAEGFDQPDDPKAGPEPLFRVRAFCQDQLAQGGRGWADDGGIVADALDGPAGVAPVAGGHVLGHRRVLAVAAGAHMRGHALALHKNLDGPGRQPHLDLLLRKTVRHAVIMPLDIDVIIDADPADAPFGEHVRLHRQRFERRPVQLFEQLAPGHAEPADRQLVIYPDQQCADRRVQLLQAVETPVAQTAENPALHDQHRSFDLRFIAGLARPCRQDRGVVMRRHLGVGPVHRGLIQAGFDHRRLGVVRHDQMRDTANGLERPGMGADPVRQTLASRSPRHR